MLTGSLGSIRCIVSFDVESLSTNVPVRETIDMIVRRAFPRNTKNFHGMTKETLRELLLICYELLGSTFANFFIDILESKIITKLIRLSVKVWFRYVDDTFVVLKSRDCVEKDMEFLNI